MEKNEYKTKNKQESKKMEFKQPKIISNPSKVISFDNANIDVSFNSLIFREAKSAELSLLIEGKPSKIITNSISVESRTAASITGDLEAKNKENGSDIRYLIFG